MLRLKSDLLPALLATADGVLENFDLRWHDDAALTVVMAANGYPGDYAKGTRDPRPRCGSAPSRAWRSSMPARAREGAPLLATGGRVLNVTARGKTVQRGAAARLCGRSPRSTGRAASAAATSAGGRIAPGEAQA